MLITMFCFIKQKFSQIVFMCVSNINKEISHLSIPEALVSVVVELQSIIYNGIHASQRDNSKIVKQYDS